MWKDRALSALLAVAIGAAAGAAVWKFSPERPEIKPEQIENGITQEATAVASSDMIAYVDGNGANAELYTFWLGMECTNLKQYYGIDVAESWDTPIDGTQTLKDFIVEDTMTAIKQQLVLENLCERYGVKLTAEDEAELAAQRASNIERLGGEDKYIEELYKLGISLEGYERLSRTDYLYNRLYEAYTTPGTELYASDDVLRAYAVGAGYVTADHILLMTIDQNTREKLDDATIAEKRQLAEDILWQLRDSSDPITLFGELADQYGEDPGRERSPEGYTFAQGTMVEEFDAAARALEENEYSDIVETQYGYHIILRRPLNVAEAVEAVRSEYFDVFFLGEIERAELVTTPAADELDPVAIYAALVAAQKTGEDAGTDTADAPAEP
ncbi:MAG: peptidylprolyl isomerase [Oscillospiraceae bacterium]|nr:peptidylprolyl isomerase [Oscillospiraceae bacterium]